MAGIYIHIPFCKKKCAYCDFYSIGLGSNSENFHKTLIKEIEVRKDFLKDNHIETIYFGGGTPSAIQAEVIGEIIASISNNFLVVTNPEITIEVNPDDITPELLTKYRTFNVNRLSIGVQSFNDDELKFLGRRHDTQKSHKAIKLANDVGFENISIDLIYGIPGSSILSWENSLITAFEAKIKHLSCYHLTFEEGTPLYRKLVKKETSYIDENLSLEQYQLLRSFSASNGYIHYEISNFAKEGFFSKHNSSYWNGSPYLGVGPSAHSFKANARFWNPNSFIGWKNGIESANPDFEGEILDIKTQFNELLLTRLRTIFGFSQTEVLDRFGKDYSDHFIKTSKNYIEKGLITFENNCYRIPSEYYFISDSIVSDLMIV